MSVLSNANNRLAADVDNELAIAELEGSILENFYTRTRVRPNFIVTPLRGTSKVSGEKIGPATVQKFGPADTEAPNDGPKMLFEDVELMIDTELFTRYSTRHLDKVLSNPATMGRVAAKQGQALAVAYDEMLINQLIKGALTPAGGTSLGGSNAIVADFADADVVEKAIRDMVVSMEMDRDIDVSDMVVYTTSDIENVLLESGNLVSALYSGTNANFAAREIRMVAGLPITTVSPKAFSAVEAAHKLGADYNVDATQAKAKVIIASEDALLVGEGLSLNVEEIPDKVAHVVHLDSTFSAGAKSFHQELSGVLSTA